MMTLNSPEVSERGKQAVHNVKMLTAARAHIADYKNWTTGKLMSRRNGHETSCAIGAVMRAGGIQRGRQNSSSGDRADLKTALAALATVTGKESYDSYVGRAFVKWSSAIYCFNDRSDTKKQHEAVLAAFDRAIANECSIVRREATDNCQIVVNSSDWTGR